MLKLAWQRRTFWWDWGGRLVTPLLAAVVVAFIGARIVADLKPIHLETGIVKFDVAQTDKSCICRNTVRKRLISIEAPVDSDGRACILRPTALERNDRRDVGEPYYLTSDFVPHVSNPDERCYRTALAHVTHSFSKVPRVSLQLSWIDAITQDATEDEIPIFVAGQGGQPPHSKALNLRFSLRAENVSSDGFDVVLQTWNDSRIYAADISYIAFVQ